ncbi:hypothetical protein ACLOJK_041311 [Asimina triloba]
MGFHRRFWGKDVDVADQSQALLMLPEMNVVTAGIETLLLRSRSGTVLTTLRLVADSFFLDAGDVTTTGCRQRLPQSSSTVVDASGVLAQANAAAAGSGVTGDHCYGGSSHALQKTDCQSQSMIFKKTSRIAQATMLAQRHDVQDSIRNNISKPQQSRSAEG